jgi:hypothetical protein
MGWTISYLGGSLFHQHLSFDYYLKWDTIESDQERHVSGVRFGAKAKVMIQFVSLGYWFSDQFQYEKFLQYNVKTSFIHPMDLNTLVYFEQRINRIFISIDFRKSAQKLTIKTVNFWVIQFIRTILSHYSLIILIIKDPLTRLLEIVKVTSKLADSIFKILFHDV